MPKDKETTRKHGKHQPVYRAYWNQVFDEDSIPRVRSYLGNAERGQEKIWTTPFAEGESTQHMLDEWSNHLEQLQNKWPSLVSFENDLRSKVGPMSVQKPLKDRIEDIRAYYDGILLPSTPIDNRAIRAVVSEFKPIRGLRVRGRQQTINNMKLSTNSGAPLWNKRREVIQATLNSEVCISNKVRAWKQAMTTISQGNAYLTAAVTGWRGQEGGPKVSDVKQRVIWMFPFAVNLLEAQVYQPLIESSQRTGLVAPWISNEAVDQNITKLFKTKQDKQPIVCTDFTKYDQHFNRHMVQAVHDILSNILAGDSRSWDWLNNVFNLKYWIPIVIGGDSQHAYLFQGEHGMGSGSGGTNADETLAHRALQYEAAMKSNQRLNPFSMCLGDDGLLTFPGISTERVIDAYSSHGMEMNESKQYVSSQDCVFLRRWHHKDYRVNGICAGVYSTMRALGRMRYLERFMSPEVWSKEAVALRQLSILENCKYHPLREEFVQFCMKRDKYRLGIDIPGFLDKIVDITKKSIDLMPDFIGYTKTLQGFEPKGIEAWWIVQYLKSLK